MDFIQLARTVDLLALAVVFGATSWFFFVQSPVLIERLGRAAFVPLQMRLTIVLFRTLSVALAVSAAATVVHSAMLTSTVSLYALGTAGLALAAGLINRHVVVPRALAAGGRSRADIAGRDQEATVSGFASYGAGNRTRRMHRTVVLFVVIMLAAVVVHGIVLLG